MMFENAFFWLSRLFVPLSLFMMHRRGVFLDNFTFGELKAVIRIGIGMQCIDMSGHIAFRLMTQQTMDKYIGLNEEQFALKKKQSTDDYLIQKNYFNNKKGNV